MVLKILRKKNQPSLEVQFKKDHKDFPTQQLKWKASSSQSTSWHQWGNHSKMFPRRIDDGVGSALACEESRDSMAKARVIEVSSWLFDL